MTKAKKKPTKRIKKPAGPSAAVTRKAITAALRAERDTALAARDVALSRLNEARQDLWRLRGVADAANEAARDHYARAAMHESTATALRERVKYLQECLAATVRAKIPDNDKANDVVLGIIQDTTPWKRRWRR